MTTDNNTEQMREEEARGLADAFIARKIGRLLPCDRSRFEGGPRPAWVFYYRRESRPGEVSQIRRISSSLSMSAAGKRDLRSRCEAWGYVDDALAL